MLASRTHLLNAQRRARPAQSHTSLQLEPQGLHTTHPLTPAPRLLPLNASGSEATAQSSAPAAKDTVTVFFKQTGRSTEAKAGEHLMDAAARCGADKEIQTGCYSGSCGICEVELHKWGLDGTPGRSLVIRACVSKVPRNQSRVEVGPIPDDQIWGQDGFDT